MTRAYTDEQRKANRDRVADWQRQNPERAATRRENWRANNRARVNKQARKRSRTAAYRAKANARRTPGQLRAAWLRRKYGITVVAWLAMFETQGRRCACCRSDDPGSKIGWHTDHDHQRRVIRGQPHIARGIVCHHCNTMLGAARDSVLRLEHGCRYLEASR